MKGFSLSNKARQRGSTPQQLPVLPSAPDSVRPPQTDAGGRACLHGAVCQGRGKGTAVCCSVPRSRQRQAAQAPAQAYSSRAVCSARVGGFTRHAFLQATHRYTLPCTLHTALRSLARGVPCRRYQSDSIIKAKLALRETRSCPGRGSLDGPHWGVAHTSLHSHLALCASCLPTVCSVSPQAATANRMPRPATMPHQPCIPVLSAAQ